MSKIKAQFPLINNPQVQAESQEPTKPLSKCRRIALIVVMAVWIFFFIFFCASCYYLFRTPANNADKGVRSPMFILVKTENGTEQKIQFTPLEEAVYLASHHSELSHRNLDAEFMRRFLVARKGDPERAVELGT